MVLGFRRVGILIKSWNSSIHWLLPHLELLNAFNMSKILLLLWRLFHLILLRTVVKARVRLLWQNWISAEITIFLLLWERYQLSILKLLLGYLLIVWYIFFIKRLDIIWSTLYRTCVSWSASELWVRLLLALALGCITREDRVLWSFSIDFIWNKIW